jgi:GDPmannose 4,6-dehydratase
MKKALICGVSGQDGAYLARWLLTNGYEIFGTSRDANVADFRNPERLGIRSKVRYESLAPNDFSISLFKVKFSAGFVGIP